MSAIHHKFPQTILSLSLAGLATTIVLSLPTPATQSSPVAANTSQSKNTLLYTNKAYGFRFTLPLSWKGYSILEKTWGDGQGPLILIRHPLWTAANPRQDIPIMVLTLAQWALVQQGKLIVSAAPIGRTNSAVIVNMFSRCRPATISPSPPATKECRTSSASTRSRLFERKRDMK